MLKIHIRSGYVNNRSEGGGSTIEANLHTSKLKFYFFIVGLIWLLLLRDDALRKSFGEAGRRRIAEKFWRYFCGSHNCGAFRTKRTNTHE